MRIIGLWILWLGACVLNAQDRDEDMAALPAGVTSVAGKLSVFADYKHPDKNGHIPLYIVNQTEAVVTLPHQDGDLYMKLEFLTKEGKWKRAQPHTYSWCGNSYGDYTVRKNHFIRINGYQPSAGKKHKVRYKMYNKEFQIWSNIGVGMVNDNDVKLAANDKMRVSFGDFKFVSDVALGKIILKNEHDRSKGLQDHAVWMLASSDFPLKDVQKTLAEVAKKFPASKRRVVDSLFHSDQRLTLCNDFALRKNMSDFDPETQRLLQKNAIRLLGYAKLNAEKSREVLRRVLVKFPKLKSEVEKALEHLNKAEKSGPLLPIIER